MSRVDDMLLSDPTPLEPTSAARAAHDRICALTATPAELAEIAELERQRAEADR